MFDGSDSRMFFQDSECTTLKRIGMKKSAVEGAGAPLPPYYTVNYPKLKSLHLELQA